MGRLAMVHRGRSGVLPPLELIEPHIDRDKYHWYWLGEFYDDGLDRSAEFRWAAPAENATRFMVPRLLWQLTHPEHQGRLLLENVCGLFTCINPGHWRERQASLRIPVRILLPEHVEAWPVVQGDEVLKVHIRHRDADTAVCGQSPRYRNMDKRTVITCEACISAWVRKDLPYTEVT